MILFGSNCKKLPAKLLSGTLRVIEKVGLLEQLLKFTLKCPFPRFNNQGSEVGQ